jgi:hypothetical protein
VNAERNVNGRIRLGKRAWKIAGSGKRQFCVADGLLVQAYVAEQHVPLAGLRRAETEKDQDDKQDQALHRRATKYDGL